MVVSATRRLLSILIISSFSIALSIAIDPSLLGVALLLLSIAIFSRVYAELSTSALTLLEVDVYRGVESDRSPVEIVYTIRNPTLVPIALAEYSLHYSSLLRLVGGSSAGVAVIPPKSSIKLRFVFSGRVGSYTIGPLYMVSRDVFGLFRSSATEVFHPIRVSIPPSIDYAVVRRLWVYTRAAGLAKSRVPGEGVELYDVREYVPGDELRKIVWRFLAYSGMLVVREAERESYQHILFVVDSSRDMWFGPPGQTPAEHCARIVAAIASYLARRGYLISAAVYSENGCILSGRPLTGLAGFRRVYNTLSQISCTEEGEVYSWLPTALRSIAVNLPREHSLILIFTRVASREKLEILTQWLKTIELKGHTAYIVTPITAGYEVADLPPYTQKLYYIKLYTTIKQDLDYINTLKKHGVKVIATKPSDIPQKIINIIELIHR
ncbi:MAG: DUF58 domain-containing protein [Ignisphaera sp.]|nr:DUF58 domain-containing protein [Ignisphaera sp.]MDW8084721.1 DUF58 domain-containing protein [Ignisphaera sp.]